MTGVAAHVILEQGHALAIEIRSIIGPLGEFATPTEIAIREAMHDFFRKGHDISRHCFTIFKMDALKGRVLRILEVKDDEKGGRITGVFEIDHRVSPTERRRPGGA